MKKKKIAGSPRVRGDKIYFRYKGKEFSTGCNDTPSGWSAAYEFWRYKLKELECGEEDGFKYDDTIANVYKKFINYKINIQKVNKNTIKLYNYHIATIFGDDLNVILNENNIRKYIDNFIKNTKLSQTSINNILAGIGVFFTWASDDEQQYIAKKNYTKRYKQNPQKKIKAPYTEAEYNTFITHFENKKQYEMSLFLQFLWHTGARGGETLNIMINDIDWKNSYIRIPNKIFKGQEETLLLSAPTIEILHKIIALKKGKNGRLFSWKRTITPIQNLEKLENKLGVKIKGRGLHGFRRSFITKLFTKDFSIDKVQEIARHQNISTTIGHYKEFNKSNLIEEMNKKLK